METVIKADNISKVYKLYRHHSDYLKELFHPVRKKYHTDFYALNSISFKIAKGETVGIIGKNGSGKSTLLKIITGVLTPSAGSFSVQGKISALLELGAGFNPDFSGLENVYFQGSIMGYSKSQIDAMIDDILDFADIGEYVYQPVKTYSSGMFVRLAFAISVAVDPDILVVDEALAVGDARFQQKCIRKMRDFMENGKTVLFVTHDMSVVNNFCSKALWIDSGQIREFGETQSITKKYLSYMAYGLETETATATEAPSVAQKGDSGTSGIPWQDVSEGESFGEGGVKITRAAMVDHETGEPLLSIDRSCRVDLYARIEVNQYMGPGGALGFIVKDRLQNQIFTINSYVHDTPVEPVDKNSILVIKISFIMPLLNVGRYSITLAFSEGTQTDHVQHHWIHDALFFDFLPQGQFNALGAVIGIDKKDVIFEKSICKAE